MARLPQPGNDIGAWGDILNDFLSQAHNHDGSVKDTGVIAAKETPAGAQAKVDTHNTSPIAHPATFVPLPSGSPSAGQVPVVTIPSPLAMGWAANGGAPTAAGEIATYQTNAMWGECFGKLEQSGISLADNAALYGAPSPTFTGDADVYALGTYNGTPCLSILKPGWHHIMVYAHTWDSVPTAGNFAVYPSCGTNNSAFSQGGYYSYMPGSLLAVAGQVEADAVIWVPPDDVPHFVVPVVWQKSGGTRTFSIWCGAWPILIDEA